MFDISRALVFRYQGLRGSLSCAQYIPHEMGLDLEDLLAYDGGAATIKISYRPYDWSVNTIDE